MFFWKSLNYIIPAIVIFIIVFMIFRSMKNGKVEREIATNPVFVEATIVKVVPGTPSTNGLVNITFDYEFNDDKGKLVERKNYLTAIKTMDLYNFNVGGKLGVMYLKTDSSKNMLTMKNALEEQ